MKEETNQEMRANWLSTPICPVCQESGEIALTNQEMLDYLVSESNGERKLAQELFPIMFPEFREQFISGLHPKCWDAMFGSFCDEHDDDIFMSPTIAFWMNESEQHGENI